MTASAPFGGDGLAQVIGVIGRIGHDNFCEAPPETDPRVLTIWRGPPKPAPRALRSAAEKAIAEVLRNASRII